MDQISDLLFPIEEIARLPLPGMTGPGALTFSPDGSWIACLHSPDASLERSLYLVNPETGERSPVRSLERSGVR